MMKLVDRYTIYIRDIKRYSSRTVDIYTSVLKDFLKMSFGEELRDISDDDVVSVMSTSMIRRYQMSLMESEPPKDPKTVGLHLSALSSFCRFLMKEGRISSNPVSYIPKPKIPKRLPVFFRNETMEKYFQRTEIYASQEFLDCFCATEEQNKRKYLYEMRLSRLVISMLYGLGLRRSELISLDVSDVDFGRKVVKVTGKGDKKREIPVVGVLCEEILLYLKAVEALCGCERSLKEPLLVTYSLRRLYPVYVDRVVKKEISSDDGAAGRKSPHALRHSLATELLNAGTDLNSIKEMLGHSSLAATQVYTHNTVAKLKNIYKQAHPRAKNGGKHGD